jgi:YVTN family beta-propeller protein
MRGRPLLVAVSGLVVAGALAAPAGAATSQPPARPAAAPAVRSVGVGSNPIDVVLSQRLGQAFVLNDGSVSVVSLRTKKELAEYSTGGFHGQNSLALVRYDRKLYITNLNRKDVTVVDTRTQKVIGHIPLGAAGLDVVATRAAIGERAYVALQTPAVVGISTLRTRVVQRTRLPQPAQSLAARPGGREIWAGGIGSGRVYVISTATARVTRTIKVDAGGPVSTLAFSPTGRTVWIAGLGGVTEVSAGTGRTIRFIPAPSIFAGFPNIGSIALTGSGHYALVQNSTFPDAPGRGTVALISTRTYRVVWRTPVGIEPIGIAVDTVRSTAYVPNYADDTLSYFRVPR